MKKGGARFGGWFEIRSGKRASCGQPLETARELKAIARNGEHGPESAAQKS
jgi:hypothetical protein